MKKAWQLSEDALTIGGLGEMAVAVAEQVDMEAMEG